jgi:hypothetical protein
LSDARNHRRKLIPRALDIVRSLNIPKDKLVFHLHTNSDPQEDPESYRYNLRADIDFLALDYVKGLRDGTPPSNLSMVDLAAIYAAADVHLLVSFGEGFGLPTLQAASSGVIPIAPANSASTELVSSHGFAIPCDTSSQDDEFGLFRHFISRQYAKSALQQLYFDTNLLRVRSAAARSFALTYSWDNAVRYWNALLSAQMSILNIKKDGAGSRLANGAQQSTERYIRDDSRMRLTGHDVSVLPIPTIGIPTRLEIRRNPKLAATPPLLLVEESCAHRFQALGIVFPGISIRRLSNRVRLKKLCATIRNSTLVIDPQSKIHARLDFICAMRGVNFLGKSDFWPSVKGRSWIMKARLLLTDYAFSDARASAATRHARNLVAMQQPQTGIQ